MASKNLNCFHVLSFFANVSRIKKFSKMVDNLKALAFGYLLQFTAVPFGWFHCCNIQDYMVTSTHKHKTTITLSLHTLVIANEVE